MTIKYPRNKDEMLDITGVGELKYEKYGYLFEETINKYISENNITITNTYDNKQELQEEKVENTVLEISTDLDLYKELRDLRDEFAHDEKRLSQSIISMNTLKEISGRYPRNLEELKDISGLGPKKIDLYGEKLLSVVNEYIDNNKIEIMQKKKKKKKQKKKKKKTKKKKQQNKKKHIDINHI
eukprot:TRINITY_DN6902_c0_g1_i3.p1 TRINITY_DN6902_c0_g1~~TRINITY_DN6902_c0_g1_i3.p1  ORF type:complete len:183 (+),score=53.64 TRINITY_DN6902_c0_g1_i3:383-931(+)